MFRLLRLLLACTVLLLVFRAFVPAAASLYGDATLWLAAHHDPLWLGLAAGFVVLGGRVGSVPSLAVVIDKVRSWAAAIRNPVPWLAVFVAAVSALGVDGVYHRFALSYDEFMLVWQAQVFLAGHMLAPIADGWVDLSPALQPMFTILDLVNGFWITGYGPLSSALYALFDLVSLGPWSNTVLAGRERRPHCGYRPPRLAGGEAGPRPGSAVPGDLSAVARHGYDPLCHDRASVP